MDFGSASRVREFGGQELSKWLSHFENLLAHADSEDCLPEEIVQFVRSEGAKASELKAEGETERDVTELKRSLSDTLKWSLHEGMPCRAPLTDRTSDMELVSRGAFGSVFRCTDDSGGSMAVKRVVKRRCLSGVVCHDHALQLATEIFCMEVLSSEESSVTLLGFREEDEFVDILMPFYEGGDLAERLNERSKLSESEAAAIVTSVAKFLKEAHDRGIVHRDIKPENILLKSWAPDSDVCVSDMGLASLFQPGEKLFGTVGTVPYMSPSMLCGQYGPETDLWSMGVLLHVLLTGREPFVGQSDEEIKRSILFGQLDFEEEFWRDISMEAKSLIAGLLERTEEKRLTASQVLDHPWICQLLQR